MGDNFSQDEYIKLVKYAGNTREFTNFGNLTKLGIGQVLWRHDIDVSLRSACEFARLDHSCGASSTFFLNIHSETYNARSSLGRRQISEIVELGHRIEVHLDSLYYGPMGTQQDLERALIHEQKVFANEFGVDVTSFSFHNPTSLDLVHSKDKYAGLINCYSTFFRESVPYVSDSNGYWRYKTATEVLANSDEPIIQVLTHPEWWAPRQFAPRERLALALFEDTFMHLELYDETLRGHHRENRSELAQNDEISGRELEIRTFKHIFTQGELG